MTEVNAENTGTAPETINNEPQDAVQAEIVREEKRVEGRSEAEKAAFSLKKNAERARELGLDPEAVLGIKKSEVSTDDDDEKPLTVGAFKAMQREDAKKNALQLADGLDTDDHTKTLVKKYLEERIRPSGDAQEDLRFALLAVSSVKNSKLAEEVQRTTSPQRFSSGAGAPPKQVSKEPELTSAELPFTKAPFNMTAAEIIAKRPQS